MRQNDETVNAYRYNIYIYLHAIITKCQTVQNALRGRGACSPLRRAKRVGVLGMSQCLYGSDVIPSGSRSFIVQRRQTDLDELARRDLVIRRSESAKLASGRTPAVQNV